MIRAVLVAAVLLIVAAGCGGGGSPKRATVSSLDVVAAFKRAGLEAERPTAIDAKDFGIAPRVTQDATRFLIPSMGADHGGRVLVFDDVDHLRQDKAAYDALGDPGTMLGSWTFANEGAGVLVQINGELDRAKAERYREVVAALGS